MPARSSRLAVLLLLIAMLVGAAPGSASAADPDKPLPVPYTFLPTAVLAGIRIGTDAPGTNDWSCKPTAAHPDPVVLVHGTFGNKSTNWQTYGPLLANQGYCVYALTYGTSPEAPANVREGFGGLAEIESSAAELKDFVAKVLASTGAAQVDLVGHSQGTLMPNFYAKFLDGAPFIDDYVSLAPLWHGTNVGGLASLNAQARRYGFPTPQFEFFPAANQMMRGSEFIENMRSGGTPAVPGDHLHEHRHQVRRAGDSVHEWNRAGHDEHRRPGRLQARPRRPPLARGRSECRAAGAQRTRPVDREEASLPARPPGPVSVVRPQIS